MLTDKDINKLEALYLKLGYDKRVVASLAQGERNEESGRLARELFIYSVKRECLSIPEVDQEWLSSRIANGASVSKRMVEAGIDLSDIRKLIQLERFDAVHGVCTLLDDSSLFRDYLPEDVSLDDFPEEYVDREEEELFLNWQLFQVDEDWEPVASIDSIHESFDYGDLV